MGSIPLQGRFGRGTLDTQLCRSKKSSSFVKEAATSKASSESSSALGQERGTVTGQETRKVTGLVCVHEALNTAISLITNQSRQELVVPVPGPQEPAKLFRSRKRMSGRWGLSTGSRGV